MLILSSYFLFPSHDPGGTVTLNQSELTAAATAEKNALVERLRSYFDETSRDKLMERRVSETENRMKELASVPYPIYKQHIVG